jgi:phosphoribosyl 1,2-cyclic phosphodiesterase/ActR/RegA family two-component response regulator
MKTILIIDDEASCRRPAAELLRRDGWTVLEAEDGESGLELARQRRPDVILCDLLMPRSNGFQLIRAVRAQSDLRTTKIVVMSGRGFAADRESATEAGADGYLVKPIEFAKLREELARMNMIGPPAPGVRTEPAREPVAEPAATVSTDRATKVKFWGVRGSIPTPGPGTVFFGGNTSCVELRVDGELIILDAGSGIRPLGQALAAEFGDRPIDINLLLTHTHWDHIQGFPFFLPAYQARNRVRIVGYSGERGNLASTLAAQMESPYFPVAMRQMQGEIVFEEQKDMSFQLGAVRVDACYSNHPGICVGYRIHSSSGSVVYLPDNESFIQHSETPHGDSLPGTLEEDLMKFIANADVLITDAQYGADEYKRHVGWGHGCLDDVVRFAIAGGVKRLYLFHHDPEHDDRTVSGMLMHARELALAAGSSIRIEAAREGEQFTLTPRPVGAM